MYVSSQRDRTVQPSDETIKSNQIKSNQIKSNRQLAKRSSSRRTRSKDINSLENNSKETHKPNKNQQQQKKLPTCLLYFVIWSFLLALILYLVVSI